MSRFVSQLYISFEQFFFSFLKRVNHAIVKIKLYFVQRCDLQSTFQENSRICQLICQSKVSVVMRVKKNVTLVPHEVSAIP